ncbi:bestrophin family protein [Legionella cardiaca]|uniref:Bestrophin family ion channel n=1 Tax=Legionella cardiaca TaxID=1071983 RepID=A0ABY8ATD8_9GAMM|nr:bestrophin family ion channel [Legionella cardiaca]WED43937.1 bestrophin family ion channel [Legionella cardiaca]
MKDNKKIVNQYEYPDFLVSALAIHGSVTPKVLKQVLVATIYACLISILKLLIPWFAIPISPFEYAGLVMGLILVFRINAGYDRWWEARKLWGSIVNSSRNLAIIIANYVSSTEKESIQHLMGYIAALPFLIKNHLRLNESIKEVEHLVDQATFLTLPQITHKPNYISSKIAGLLSLLLKENKINEFSFLKAEECREIVIDCQGACERILKTPMPFVMAIKSRRFILLFLLILPIALVDYSIYINPLVTALVAYALFSLDQIGIELQNPFSPERLSHLPLGDICRGIENNVMEIYSNHGSNCIKNYDHKTPSLKRIKDKIQTTL